MNVITGLAPQRNMLVPFDLGYQDAQWKVSLNSNYGWCDANI